MDDRTVISAVIILLVALLLAEIFPGKPAPSPPATALCSERRWTGDPDHPFEQVAQLCEGEAPSR